MSKIQNKKMQVQQITIEAEQASRRIDNFLSGRLKKLPKARIYQMVRRGEVRVNSKRIKQDYRLQPGDVVRIPPVLIQDCGDGKPPPPDSILAKLKNCVIYENNDIVVLNKPSGIAVHGGSGLDYGIIEILRYLRPEQAGLQLVHRLDRETSGCLLLAKNMTALKRLHNAFKKGEIVKKYQVLLKGTLKKSPVTINQPLKKNVVSSGERMVITGQGGKSALTRFNAEQRLRQTTLAQVSIETGRTHQIRVHAGYMGNPVVGDHKYGDKKFNQLAKKRGLKRLFLHATLLRLPEDILPGLRQWEFQAPLPHDLTAFLASEK